MMMFRLILRVYAQEEGVTPPSSSGGDTIIPNPISITTIPELIDKILKIVVNIGLPVVVLAIVYTGFLYVTARGNEEKLRSAHQALVWTLIGAAIVLGAQVISSTIKATVGELRA